MASFSRHSIKCKFQCILPRRKKCFRHPLKFNERNEEGTQRVNHDECARKYFKHATVQVYWALYLNILHAKYWIRRMLKYFPDCGPSWWLSNSLQVLLGYLWNFRLFRWKCSRLIKQDELTQTRSKVRKNLVIFFNYTLLLNNKINFLISCSTFEFNRVASGAGVSCYVAKIFRQIEWAIRVSLFSSISLLK